MLHRAGVLVSLLALSALGCPGQRAPVAAPKPPPAAAAAPPEKVEWRMSKSGLGFRLRDAEPSPAPRPKLAPAVPLSKADAAAVLRRLSPMKTRAKTASFALRDKSMPAPRPGETIKTPFPPPAGPPPATPGAAKRPLTVQRWAPEGDIAIAPSLSVTFSQPMVAVTAHHELGRESVPVRLTPEPAGRWRWIGTQTVLFEPKGERFPMSTEYRVSVPAGTRAVSGAALAQEKSFTFTTPELRIVERHPSWGDPTDLLPVVFARFNQKIDRSALLGHLSLSAGEDKLALRLATEDEIEADAEVRGRIRGVEPEYWIALRATEPLPKATHIEVVLAEGAPSAEGPRRTTSQQKIEFNTYGPLKLRHVRCGWRTQCPPLASWYAELTNPLDGSKFEPSMVRVEPELPDQRIDVSGRAITIRGRSKGRTKYTVTLAPGITDTFGQTLEQPAKDEVQVGEAEPILFSEQDDMIVLDPAFEPKLSVYSVNRPLLNVRLYAVTPKDWARYVKFRRDWDWDQKVTQPPGRLVARRAVRPQPLRDELVETQIDLGPALKGGFGHVIAVVEPPVQPKGDRWRWEREWVRTWVQVTKTGLGAIADDEALWAWTTNLGDGAPLGGVEVSVLGGDAGRSRADGLAQLKLGPGGDLVIAKRGDDVVFVPGADTTGSFTARPRSDSLRWFSFDDRGLYKPGERVNVKGWLRLRQSGKRGDLQRLPRSAGRTVRWTAYEPRGNEVARGETSLDGDGGFHLSFDLPKNANLGRGRVQLEVAGFGAWNTRHSHYFSMEEFRRPEFEVTAETTAGPHFVGRHAIATVSASYYAGGGLGEAEVLWSVAAQDAHYTPPNRSGWQFGKPRRWSWWDRDDEDRKGRETWPTKTGAGGQHRLRIDFDALEPAYPRQIALEATVTDVNRQSWTARSQLLVHPARVSVGLRTDTRLISAGQSIVLDALTTDIDGKTVTGRPIRVESARIETSWRGGRTIEKQADVQTCSLTSAAEPGRCNLPTRGGGLHRITAETSDEHGRKSHTQIEVWVLGQDPPQNPNLRRGKVEVVPDKTEYRGGDTAELFVVAPFAPAEGVLSLRRDGVVDIRRFKLTQRSETVRVKLDPSWLPNVTARIDLVGAMPRENERGEPDASLPKRPAFASGEVDLSLPPAERTLSIGVAPRDRQLQPGGKTRVGVLVTDAGGRPVPGANLALVVVDESVLALAGYELPNPIEVFYTRRPEGVNDYETRLNVALMRPDTARMEVRAKETDALKPSPKKKARNGGSVGYGYGSAAGVSRMSKATVAGAPPAPAAAAEAKAGDKARADGKPDAPTTPIAVRRDFSALATFVPRVVTDSAGRAEVSVKLPESLTRYRVMAVAASGDNRFGSAESAITARLPLMVRPSYPRFLNYGDRFSLPVVLQNQTTVPLTVDVAARGDNVQLLEPAGLRVRVPPSDRVEVRFPARAKMAGTARFQVAAAAGKLADANEDELPVWTPATTEAFATYGQIDQGAVGQKVQLPRGVVTEFGGLEITTASTGLQGLTDALLYLVRYPFECNEQVASRMLAIAALRDVLAAFRASEMPSPKALAAFMAKDVERLKSRQHYSGGWDYWRKDREPNPFVSAHAAHALVMARAKRFSVPQQMITGALNYLRNIRHRFPHWYTPDARRVIESYAILVRDKAGEPDPARARAILAEAGGPEKLPLDALGWLLPVLSKDNASQAEVAAIRRHLDNRVAETAGKAHFVTSIDEEDGHILLASSRRSDGIVLEATIADRPESDLVPKVVSGLLAHRKRGRWLNTQENVFILLALDRYFQTYEKATPDFVARAWLGSGLALEHRFRGRSADRQHVDVPLGWLAKTPGPTDLVIAKQGTGRLYYRVGMQYAPADLRPPPAEHGFSVSRTYEGVDNPDDVRRDRDGTWRMRLGSLVRSRVSMVAPARRYHVALVDPLPAGLEPLNPALATTQSIPKDPKQAKSKQPWWWSRAWYEHQNLRDERVEAFASLLWEGVYDYTYVARATTPGEFVVPPPKAEEMYDPETFGRGAGDRVIIE